jgi:mRNA-degrading endonuclease RelE of RelBE toxin-antitoxin system
MPPYRIEWAGDAPSDIRAIDRDTAMHLFAGVLRYARSGAGDVEPLHGKLSGSFRLRVSEYRVLFTLENNIMMIFGVRHRSEAYR